ncbi:DUF5682 family protein [Umezawaea beigongshangensis]|uniref:DUF5682 family protein n=1 Tax=Umezawaea beigongshangensis TaxID=2780383 RepID=UPI0018F26155|nr:DUF5682 family protein [Umezawaea beigongshangensis]
MTSSTPDPARTAADELAGCREPFLIGVRHHSPALAVAVPELLDAARPEVLLVELPTELGEWLPWLGHPDTTAPVALSGAARDGGGLAFYPFADFSPELAAIRWARRNDVEVVPCDLPLALRGDRHEHEAGAAPLTAALRRGTTGRDGDDLWDRLVEAVAPGQSAEAVRRAALLVGWALRHDAGTAVDPHDLRREAWMRRALADVAGRRSAAVVGSFHAAALLSGGPLPGDPHDVVPDDAPIVTSLVPYAFGLLDERSGYPSGIRDPEWQQAVLLAGGDPLALERAATEVVVRICAGVRDRGHPAGPGEAREVLRLAVDLARLRGLPAPGRGELVEALQTVLTAAEPLGRGRIVARAAGDVLVGTRTGVLAAGTPRSGLLPAVEALLAELRLPGPAESGTPADLRLDPLRSALDARRQLALRQLAVLGVSYAEETETTGVGGGDALTTRWRAAWTPSTAATLPVAGLWGVTLPQAAEGRLRARRAEEDRAGGATAEQVLAGLRAAAGCGLAALVTDRLDDVATVLPASATLGQLLTGLDLLDRIGSGHLPGLASDLLGARPRLVDELEAAAVAQLDGTAGSDDLADAHAVVDLGRRHDGRGTGLRLAATLRRMADDGSPLMQGAAAATRVLLELQRPEELGERAASWVDTASTSDDRATLRRRLTGVLTAAAVLLETPEALTPLLDRVESLPDQDFLDRLPALRGAFTSVGPAARQRVLDTVLDRTGERVDDPRGADPELVAVWLHAERAGLDALSAHGLDAPARRPEPEEPQVSTGAAPATAAPGGELPSSLRWRLVLARRGDRPDGAARYAAALDELYGRERGEGASGGLGADRSAAFPGVREWSAELEALFGDGVREEVLAAAVEAGRSDAALELDPAAVRPSVTLLRTVLSLAGGLPESAVARLRPLVARLVAELAAQLANRMRPALAGLQLPRPSRRPGGRLDLHRTIRANLATARRDAAGHVVVVPERPVFRTRARRGNDWRLVLVVDVSGSMEASTVWSALTAAVFAGVPSLTTHFLAFSTEVIDLTDRVADPLSLLLEVRVGGGTHIAGGLRHARTLVTVPERTMVVVVSDFEEGGPLGDLLAQTRELVSSGVRVLGCASLDDTGRARYSTSTAGALVAAGMPVAALGPLELARWVGEQIR